MSHPLDEKGRGIPVNVYRSGSVRYAPNDPSHDEPAATAYLRADERIQLGSVDTFRLYYRGRDGFLRPMEYIDNSIHPRAIMFRPSIRGAAFISPTWRTT